jgi:hypothetical protein
VPERGSPLFFGPVPFPRREGSCLEMRDLEYGLRPTWGPDRLGHLFKRPFTDNLWNYKNASNNVTGPKCPPNRAQPPSPAAGSATRASPPRSRTPIRSATNCLRPVATACRCWRGSTSDQIASVTAGGGAWRQSPQDGGFVGLAASESEIQHAYKLCFLVGCFSRCQFRFSVPRKKQVQGLGHHILHTPPLFGSHAFELAAYLLWEMHGDGFGREPRRGLRAR